LPIPLQKNAIESVYELFRQIFRPALEVSKEYGECTEEQKLNFLYGVINFIKFLNSTQENLATCRIEFPIDEEFYNGYLMSKDQKDKTPKTRERVLLVEALFSQWLEQIRVVVCQGTQLMSENSDHGPLKELEHWRKMLAKLCHVFEFLQSKMFATYLKCLKISRSKLVSVCFLAGGFI
jgi:dynein heavy chain